MSKFKVGDVIRWIPGTERRCIPEARLRSSIATVRELTGADIFSFTLSDDPFCEWNGEESSFELATPITTLPLDSTARKEYPIYRGLLKYFPAALAEVAHVSKIGNDKHRPGQEMGHTRAKSNDHADCILRHLIDLSEDYGKGIGVDENGVPQAAYIAWRALALCQIWLEEKRSAPKAPAAE